MVGSWSVVEIIRYSFYAIGLVNKAMIPKSLFWLRYSAFIVLYPSGISGAIPSLFSNTLPF